MTRPVVLMGPHAAAMGIKFYTGKMFPAEYQNTVFVVRKGSWNREKPFGFDVVNVRVSDDGKATIRPFASGWQEGGEGYKFWGRPAYVQQMPDGAMLVSDEQTGAIYRISYQQAGRPRRNSAIAPQGAVGMPCSPPFLFRAPFRKTAAALRVLPRAGRQLGRPPGTPSIAGQPKLFMENQLVLFREGIRKSPVMTPLMAGISDKEIQQLSDHFSKQPAKPDLHAALRTSSCSKQGQGRWRRTCAAGSATCRISAGRSRCPAWRGSARTTCSPRCSPTAPTSAPTPP